MHLNLNATNVIIGFFRFHDSAHMSPTRPITIENNLFLRNTGTAFDWLLLSGFSCCTPFRIFLIIITGDFERCKHSNISMVHNERDSTSHLLSFPLSFEDFHADHWAPAHLLKIKRCPSPAGDTLKVSQANLIFLFSVQVPGRPVTLNNGHR